MAVFEAFLAASLRCCGPRSPDPPGVDALETSLRKLRDVLIGNRGRKAECVDAGCVAPLLAVASSSQTAVARSLAACCLCSLAHGVRDRVLALDPMPALLDCVGGSSSDKKTVENALRAIRALVAGSGGSPAVVEARRAVLSRCASLVAMLDYAGQPRTASLITDILASICVDSKAQEVLLGLGVSSKLIGVLVSGNLGTGQSASHSDLDKGAKLRTRLCVAVLSALAALTRNNAASSEPLCDAGTGHGSFAIRTLFRLTRDRNSHLRLLSSMW